MTKVKAKTKTNTKEETNEETQQTPQTSLSLDEMRQLIAAKERERILEAKKEPISEEFIYTVKMCGTGCHVLLPRRWLGRKIRIKIEDVTTEQK